MATTCAESPASRAAEADLEACRAILARGSKSFAAAARLLPGAVRDRSAAVYAFCRVADDAVDEGADPEGAVDGLAARLDRIYAGRPDPDPVDRSLCRVVEATALPRAPFDGLLEGFSWDARGRAYPDLSSVRAYGVRVAGTVGVLMSALMDRRAPHTLARACDLGVAMQLTNIARDVAADAEAGRVYLPLDWLAEAGVDPGDLLARRHDDAALAAAVRRLLDEAARLYARARAGITELPVGSRVAICAAALIYADIGDRIRRAGYRTDAGRAVVPGWRKTILVARALPALAWRPRPDDAPPLPEARALVEATARR
jgi:15-cis-phytoene synthase